MNYFLLIGSAAIVVAFLIFTKVIKFNDKMKVGHWIILVIAFPYIWVIGIFMADSILDILSSKIAGVNGWNTFISSVETTHIANNPDIENLKKTIRLSGYDIVISFATLSALIWAANAYRKQANNLGIQAKELGKQTAKIEEGKIAEQYRIAVKMLDPLVSPPNWYSGLQFAETIAIGNISTYGNNTISHLIEVARIFSDEEHFRIDINQISGIKSSLRVTRKERHRFIFKVIEAISRIYIATVNYRDKNGKKLEKQKFHFIDIKLPLYKGRATNSMLRAFFEDVVFTNCDFSNIQFHSANFVGATFDKNCKFDLHFCFASLTYDDISNDFIRNSNFIVNGPLYYWNDLVNKGAMQDNLQKYGIFDNKLRPMPIEKFEKWARKPAPRIPDGGERKYDEEI